MIGPCVLFSELFDVDVKGATTVPGMVLEDWKNELIILNNHFNIAWPPVHFSQMNLTIRFRTARSYREQAGRLRSSQSRDPRVSYGTKWLRVRVGIS